MLEVRKIIDFLQHFQASSVSFVKDHVAGKLDKVEFPYVREAPSAIPLPVTARPTPSPTTSLRSQKPAWHRAAKPGASAAEIRQRVMIFVFGGMTYSEIREAYLLSTALNKDIYIGMGGLLLCKNRVF